MSTLPTCLLAPPLTSRSWQDFSQQKVDPVLFKGHTGWALTSWLHPHPHPEPCGRLHQDADSLCLRGLYVFPVRHQHPTSSYWPKTQCPGPSPTRRAAHMPLRAHTGQLCLTPAQLKSEGRKMLTPCMVCIFNVSSFPSWRISLGYQMPLCSLQGTQTNPDTRVPGRGLRTRKCAVRSHMGCSHSKCCRSSESRRSSRGGEGRKRSWSRAPRWGEGRAEDRGDHHR